MQNTTKKQLLQPFEIKPISLIIPLIVIALLSCVSFLQKVGGNMDSIWNFGIIRALAEGNAPYQDVSMVQTPIWAYIAVPFALLFGKSFFTMNFLKWLVLTGITFISYTLFYRSTRSIINAVLLSSITFLASVFTIVYSYNALTLLVLLIGSLIDLRENQEIKNQYPFLMGLLYGSAMLFKQSTGLAILITHTILCLFFAIKDRKTVWLKRIVPSFLPTVFMLFFFYAFGIWNDFMEYAVSGLSSFAQNLNFNFEINMIGGITLYAACGIVFLIALFKGKLQSEEAFTGIVSFSFMSNLIPVIDSCRFMWCIVAVLPATVISIERLRSHESAKPKRFLSVTGKIFGLLIQGCVAFFLLTVYTESGIVTYNLNSFAKTGTYAFVPVSENFSKMAEQITAVSEKYERNGYEVYYASADGTLYDLYRGRYVKNFDLLLSGNVGLNTEADLFNQATENGKTAFMILEKEEYGCCKQEMEELRQMIISDCEKTDTVIGEVYRFYEWNG